MVKRLWNLERTRTGKFLFPLYADAKEKEMTAAARRIEDYAMIGDCRSAALVSRDGSIDWLCWPRFDSPACFAALLGERDHGRWLLAPQEPYRTRRCYRDSTLILETEFETDRGSVTVIDCMPAGDGAPSVIRQVVGRSGCVPMRTELVLRFDYGITVPWVRHSAPGELTAIAGPNLVVLRSQVRLRGEDLRSVAEWEVRQGETHTFVLSYCESFGVVPPPLDAAAALALTEQRWRDWASRCADAGPWSALVRRSLLTVRGLTYRPTGGIVAAPTTSLPEHLGGQRNWDYRFCWLRDATFTLLALMKAGYYDEAAAWRDWLTHAVAGSPEQLQILYGVAGERDLPERELPWLPGFAGSAPVLVGNAASNQFQLDVYGELANMMGQARKGGLRANHRAHDLRLSIMRHLEEVWHLPDEGIWEVRGGPRHFTYSKVMAWLAFRQAADNEAAHDSPEDHARWLRNAEQIHAQVCREAYDPAQGCFVQSYGSKHLDASLLLLPIVGFLPPQDPRIVGTVAAIERRLIHHGLVRRYETESGVDGLPPGEGAFLACSFWLVDCYLLLGRKDDARRLFERLAGLCNDVGLLAEEYDPQDCCMLGNFPQAFSHVAMVNAAFNLHHALQPG
jgi:GH15 family glucan-1,4-alpha-glucosidase